MTERNSNRGGHTAAWVAALAALLTAILGGGGILGLFTYCSAQSHPDQPAGPPPSSTTVVPAPAVRATSATPATPAGTKLGHYAVDLADGYMLRLEPTKQTPQECCDGAYDLIYWQISSSFSVGDRGGALTLYDGPADYHACKDDTQFTQQIFYTEDLSGQTICYTGRHLVVAARITKMAGRLSVFPGAYVSLDITVWQD